MKSLSLIVAVLSLGLLVAGASPAFAAKGLKGSSKVAATQNSTDGKGGKHHRHHHKHQKLTKQEKKAIKHEMKKQLKKQSTTASKL
jgi:hypothetical protein